MGVSLRAVSVAVAPAVSIIGVTTLLCCIVALAIGKRFGHLLGDRAQIVGGVVLVLIGHQGDTAGLAVLANYGSCRRCKRPWLRILDSAFDSHTEMRVVLVSSEPHSTGRFH